ncbi:MAG: DUF4956 domain-containing protein [Selenomonadaceae bacterium]|nr:DUF4956 domain-containing protein [Selenomonadaceae bacterium]
MSFKDIIKNRVLEHFTGASGFSLPEIFLILFLACVIGGYIFLVYRHFTKKAFYSKDLNITLAGLTVIVAAVMIAMQSNLLVSLGMVGALSIVRFRTAVKNPMDLLYLFWSITEGIVCGVNLYVLGMVLCMIMTAMLWILERVRGVKSSALLIVRTSMNIDAEQVTEIILRQNPNAKESSISVKNNEREFIFEVDAQNKDALIKEIESKQNVLSVNWLEHHGEMRV